MSGASRRAVVAVAVVWVCLVAFALPASVAAAASGSTGAATPPGVAGPVPQTAAPPGFAQMNFDPDRTVIRIDVREDGSARWSVQYTLDLETANDTEAFQALRDDIRANSSAYVEDFARGIRATAADAANATGREMAVSNFSVTTEYDSIKPRQGSVIYSFTWSNFASTDGDRIVVGDALAGFFLDEQTTLVVSWPDAYERQSVDPPGQVSEHSVAWSGGDVTFDASGPRVVVARGGGGVPVALVGAAVAVLVLGAVGGYAVYRRRTGTVAPGGDDAAAAEAAPASPSTDDGDGTATAGGGAAGADGDTEAATEPPAELLSNEERVLRLLEERGGRVKQQEIVSELDWTAAKTSQVVNGMHDDGRIEKFRLGRENVIKLPDDEGGEDAGA